MTLAFPDDALKFPYELLFLLPCRGKGIPYVQVGVSVSPNKVEDYIYSFAHYLIFSLPSSYKEYNIIIYYITLLHAYIFKFHISTTLDISTRISSSDF